MFLHNWLQYSFNYLRIKNMKFKENLKILINRRNLSQTNFANLIGKKPSNVSSWTKGVVPSIEIIKEIADFFKVSIDELVYKDLEKTNKGIEAKQNLNLQENNTALNEELIEYFTENDKLFKDKLLHLLLNDKDIATTLQAHLKEILQKKIKEEKVKDLYFLLEKDKNL